MDEKLTLTGYGIVNLNDSSLAFGGVADYFINDNLEFIIMPFVIAGDATSEYGSQKASYGNYGAAAKLKWVF